VNLCGDGIVEAPETCDPPNACTGPYCCDSMCRFGPRLDCESCEKKTYTTEPAHSDCSSHLYSSASGFGCDAFTDPADVKACIALRECLITSHCAVGDDMTACYGGARDAISCASVGPDGTGACLAQYDAVKLPPGILLPDVFTNPRSVVGVANNITACDLAANCPCGQ
jgi:hypothetical protein